MSSLKKSGIIIVILSLFVKLIGFLRESIIAKQFGASAITDGYLIAFSVVTLVVIMTSEGFNSVFLPLFLKEKQKNEAASMKTASGLLNRMIIGLLTLTIIMYVLIPFLIPLLFRNTPEETVTIIIELTQFFTLFLTLISLNGMFESYLQAYRSFIPTQIARLLATVTAVVFALLFADIWGIYSLAYGFITGTFLGILCQLYFLIGKYKFKYSLSFSINPTFKQQFLALFFPAILSAVVGQINVLVDKIFSSGTMKGAVTYLNNSSLLISIPNAIFASTIVAIIFTLLSEQTGQLKEFQNIFSRGIKITALLLMPITAGFIVLGLPLIQFVYERGAFSHNDSLQTLQAFYVYLPLILIQGFQYIVLKAMYAKGQTKIIFFLSSITIILNIIFNYFFVQWFGYLGTALSSTLIAFFFLLSSTRILTREFEAGQMLVNSKIIVRSMIPALFMGIPLYFMQQLHIFEQMAPLLNIMITGILGVILYLIGLRYFYKDGFLEVMELVPSNIRNKIIR